MTGQGRIGIALFGLGGAGTIHIQNIFRNSRLTLKYVVRHNVQAARDFLQHMNHPEVEVLKPEESDKLFNDNSVDAVIVCTPTTSHEDIVLQSLRKGKAVFCEKPVAEDLGKMVHCYEEAEKAGTPLLCAFNRRFDPGLGAIADKVHAGDLGKVQIIKTTARDYPSPSEEYLKSSGGIFHDCAIHDIDLVCWVLGEYPNSVFAHGHAHSDVVKANNDVDTVVLNMQFPSGAVCCIDLSRYSPYGYDQRLEVHGNLGMLQNDNPCSDTVKCYTKNGVSDGMLTSGFAQRYAESFTNSLDHFIDVIQGKAKAAVSKENAIAVSKIATACTKSCQSRQAVALNIGHAWK